MQQMPPPVFVGQPGSTGSANLVSFPIIVIGASAGGLQAIKQLVAKLPPHLGAAIFIVWHMPATALGIVPDIINRLGTLHASHAINGETIQPDHIYIAPPDHHLIIEGLRLRTAKGPKENHFRPAVDPLFRSAAYEYGSQVIGIILSGALNDGSSGLWMVKHRGGTAIVQDPLDAQVSSMPASAARFVAVDYSVPVADMPALLVTLVKEQLLMPKNIVMDKDEKLAFEISIAADEHLLSNDVFKLGELTPFTCPECHGVLTSIIEGNLKRFRCHTGHAFTTDALLSALTENIEENMWTAIRSLRESSMLMNHIGDHYAEHNQPAVASQFFRKAREADEHARQVRDVVSHHQLLSEEEVAEEAGKKGVEKAG